MPVVARWFGVGAVLFTLVLPAGCTTTENRTLAPAERLERSAVTFSAATCSGPGIQCGDNLSVTAAHDFADNARDFRATVESSGDREVLSSFERLWHSY